MKKEQTDINTALDKKAIQIEGRISKARKLLLELEEALSAIKTTKRFFLNDTFVLVNDPDLDAISTQMDVMPQEPKKRAGATQTDVVRSFVLQYLEKFGPDTSRRMYDKFNDETNSKLELQQFSFILTQTLAKNKEVKWYSVKGEPNERARWYGLPNWWINDALDVNRVRQIHRKLDEIKRTPISAS